VLLRTIVAVGGFAVLHYLAALLGDNLIFPATPVSVFWPASAVLLAALLVAPRRMWWLFVLAVLPGHLVIVVPQGIPPRVVLIQLLVNCGLALLGAVVIDRLVGAPRRFDRLGAMALFILVGAVVVPVVMSASVAGAFAGIGWSRNFWVTWRVRSLSNALAVLTVTPLLIVLLDRIMSSARIRWRRIVEAAALLGSLTGIGFFLFATPAGAGASPALLYAPLPFLLWATVRFGVGGVCVSVLALGGLSLWGAVRGYGPFLTQSPAENVTSLLLFLNVAAASLLMLAALLEERRQTSQALAESEQRFHVMADTAPVMIWRAGMDGRCDFFNASWVAFTGRSIPEKADDGWAEGAHPDDLEPCLLTYRAAFGARTPFQMEYRLRRFDGEYRWLIVTGVPRFGPDGDFAGYIGSCLEITDRKQAELELQVQRQELAHLTRVAVVSEMSAALAHELSQPLSAILANAQAALRLLARPPVDLAEMREIVEDVVKDDQRAGDLIRRVRTLLKKGKTEVQDFDLGETVGETVSLAHGELVTRRVKLHLVVASALPLVRGDRVQFQQVLLNLIVNACEAMTDLEPAERVVTISAAERDHAIQISVQDRGTGISPAVLGQLFTPFVTTKEQGLGLGLSICHSIVTAHGGRLWATNNAEGGATFWFSVPVPADRR
jgi:two-component system, LuxR family, sensor kinase FixL